MRVFAIAWKDLYQIARQWRSVLALLGMPILFTAFMGLSQGTPVAAGSRLRVAVVLEEESWLSLRFERALQDIELLTPSRAANAEEATAWLLEGRVTGTVIVPDGFGARLESRQPPGLILVTDSMTWPGQLVQQAVQRAVLRLAAATGAAHQTLDRTAQRPLDGTSPVAPLWSRATARALDNWRGLSAPLHVEHLGDVATSSTAPAASGALAHTAPGMVVMFAILGLVRSAMVLVDERRQGTLARAFTTSTPGWMLIAGHLLGIFAVVFAQELILVITGQLAFGLPYSRAPLATLWLLASLALWVASLAMLIAALAKGPEQVVLFGFIATIALCALGGTWFPLEATGGAFMRVGALTPAAWAMKGFRSILNSAAPLSTVAISSACLCGYAALCFVPAARQIRNR